MTQGNRVAFIDWQNQLMYRNRSSDIYLGVSSFMKLGRNLCQFSPVCKVLRFRQSHWSFYLLVPSMVSTTNLPYELSFYYDGLMVIMTWERSSWFELVCFDGDIQQITSRKNVFVCCWQYHVRVTWLGSIYLFRPKLFLRPMQITLLWCFRATEVDSIRLFHWAYLQSLQRRINTRYSFPDTAWVRLTLQSLENGYLATFLRITIDMKKILCSFAFVKQPQRVTKKSSIN